MNTNIPEQQNLKHSLAKDWFINNAWIFIIFAISLIYLFNKSYFSSPPLHSDDWTIFATKAFSEFPVFDLTDRRPLISLPYWVLTNIFGFRLHWYYLIGYVLTSISGLLVYIITRKLIPSCKWLWLPVAIFFLIYPTDFTKTWLIHVHARFVLVSTLGVILLLISYKDTGKLIHIILANLIFVVSLLIYEAGLGLVVAMSSVLLWMDYKQNRSRKLLLLSPIIIAGLFSIWRLFFQSTFFDVQDNYLSSLDFNPIAIGTRYLRGFLITFYNWIYPLLYQFDDKNKLAIGVVGVIGLIVLLAIVVMKAKRTQSSAKQKEQQTSFKQLLKVWLIGIALWVAGYIPTIIYDTPAVWGDDSRFNLFSTFGSALIFVSGVALVVSILVKQQSIKKVSISILIPFALVAMCYQVWSQTERIEAWKVQKQFWQSTFEVIPNLEDGTELIILIPGFTELSQFEILPFSGNWEARSAIKLLYNNESLQARYAYMDLPESNSNRFPDYDEWSSRVIVCLKTDPIRIVILDDPASQIAQISEFQDYQPFARIISPYTDTFRYRLQIK